MPTKRFLIHYPDGTKEQVPTAKKEQLLLAGELRPIDANRFAYIGERKTLIMHDFRELSKLAVLLNVTPAQLQRFLEGHYLRKGFEPLEREVAIGPCLGDLNRPSEHEYMETEHSLAIRVKSVCPALT